MKIEDLIQILNNRLREFKLSRDYARMSGNLEGVNVADKEVIDLEDTLFQLNLLVDTSKSAAVREATLAEVITDGSVSVLGEYDITPYATDPLHEEKIMNILSKMGVMDTVEKTDDYIKSKCLSSPVTGEMIMSAAKAYMVDTRLMMAIIQQDSSFGTAGVAVSTLNPGNVGNNDDGDLVTYESWQEGVTAVAGWLSRHRISAGLTATSTDQSTATSTSPILTPTTATSTEEVMPVITSTSTTTTATTTPMTFTITPDTATSTEEVMPVITSTSTTTTSSTSSPQAATTTPLTFTITPDTATSTEEVMPVITSTSTATTPVTATSTEEVIPPITLTPTTTTSTTTTATTTPMIATLTEETMPVITSTSTTTTAN